MAKTQHGRRPSRRTTGVVAATALTLVATLAACGAGGSGGSSAGGDDGELTIGLAFPPQSLDPGKNGGGGQNIVQWLTYEPLIRMESDGSLSPALATEWGYVGEGNTAFELTLREGVTFADGTPVDADAVVATLEHYLANPAALSHFLNGISEVTADGPTTVRIALSEPNPVLPLVLSQAANWGDVISPAGLADPTQLTTDTFGAGPYELDETATVAGDTYTFLPNENYWQPELQHYDRVVVKVLPDPNSALQALRTGQIDVDMNGNGTLADQAEELGAEVLRGNASASAVFVLDRAGTVTPALGEPEVREALNTAIDRDAIAAALGTGYAPTQQVATEGSDGFDAGLDDTYEYDPERARELLADAGYPDGFSFTMLTTDLLGLSTVAQAVAGQLAEIGVDVTVESTGTDLNRLIADMASQQYSAVTFVMGGDMYPNALQNFVSAQSPLNPFASEDPGITAAFDTLAASAEDGRETAAQELNRAVVETAWFVPAVTSEGFVFTRGIADPGTVGTGGVLDVLSWRPAA